MLPRAAGLLHAAQKALLRPEGLGAWPETRLAALWWEIVPVWRPFFGTEWDGQAF